LDLEMLRLNEFKNYFMLTWIFVAYFLSTDISTDQIALFYDVKDRNPVGEHSFKVIARIAKSYVDLQGTIYNEPTGVSEPLRVEALSSKEFEVHFRVRQGRNEITLTTEAYDQEGTKSGLLQGRETAITEGTTNTIRAGAVIQIPARKKYQCTLPLEYQNDITITPESNGKPVFSEGWITAGDAVGTFMLTGRNADGHRYDYEIEVTENRPPQFRSGVDDFESLKHRSGAEFTMARYVEDPEGGKVSMNVSTIPEALSVLVDDKAVVPTGAERWYPIDQVVLSCVQAPKHGGQDFEVQLRDEDGFSRKLRFRYW
jgi:hypothetical protein